MTTDDHFTPVRIWRQSPNLPNFMSVSDYRILPTPRADAPARARVFGYPPAPTYEQHGQAVVIYPQYYRVQNGSGVAFVHLPADVRSVLTANGWVFVEAGEVGK